MVVFVMMAPLEEMNLESSQGVEVVEEARERGGSMMIIL